MSRSMPINHMTNEAIDGMVAALRKQFAIYHDEEAGVDVEQDAMALLDALVDAGHMVVPAPKAGVLGGYSWDCPNCGQHVTTWLKPPPLATPTPDDRDREVERIAADARRAVMMSWLDATKEAVELLNSLGIAGPNIIHAEQGMYPDGKASFENTWDGPGWCVCRRVWPCEAKRLGDLLMAPNAGLRASGGADDHFDDGPEFGSFTGGAT